MPKVPLAQGQVAIVDDEDFERVSAFEWEARWHPGTRTFYAVRKVWVGRKVVQTVALHRWILNAPEGVLVDHRDGNTLDCRKANLRTATHAQNSRNSAQHRDNTSGFKGVSKSGKKWAAYITVNRKPQYLGRFDKPVDAARAYDQAARKHFGEFARLNFPKEGEASAAYVYRKRPTRDGSDPSKLVWVEVTGFRMLLPPDDPRIWS